MINGILDLSKLESSKLELTTEPTEFAAYLRRLVSNFESQASYQGIDYQFNHALEDNVYYSLV